VLSEPLSILRGSRFQHVTTGGSCPTFTNVILQITLPKFCKMFFNQRFTLTMDPKLSV